MLHSVAELDSVNAAMHAVALRHAKELLATHRHQKAVQLMHARRVLRAVFHGAPADLLSEVTPLRTVLILDARELGSVNVGELWGKL
jgi:hypothetical protein